MMRNDYVKKLEAAIHVLLFGLAVSLIVNILLACWYRDAAEKLLSYGIR